MGWRDGKDDLFYSLTYFLHSQNMENMTKLENIISSVTQLESGG